MRRDLPADRCERGLEDLGLVAVPLVLRIAEPAAAALSDGAARLPAVLGHVLRTRPPDSGVQLEQLVLIEPGHRITRRLGYEPLLSSRHRVENSPVHAAPPTGRRTRRRPGEPSCRIRLGVGQRLRTVLWLVRRSVVPPRRARCAPRRDGTCLARPRVALV